MFVEEKNPNVANIEYFEKNSEKISIGAYIKHSVYRGKVMSYLQKHQFSTPTQIAKGTGIRTNHISKVLFELKQKKVIICINEEMRKGRLYMITDFGREVIKAMEILE